MGCSRNWCSAFRGKNSNMNLSGSRDRRNEVDMRVQVSRSKDWDELDVMPAHQ